MEFAEYQLRADDTALYGGQDTIQGLMYAGLGIANEAGEVAGKIKKLFRDNPDVTEIFQYPTEVKEAIAKEVGDVLWYASQVLSEIGYDLDEVAIGNLEKLADRARRGVISGSGDNR